MNNLPKQSGATLIELLISIVIGLIIAASMLGMYVTSTANSSQLLKSSKLNQELTSLMSVMVNDIRRAGFWSNENAQNAYENPFSQDDTALFINGDCITYAYDSSIDNVLNENDVFGFRLNNGTVEMRESGAINAVNNCTDDSEWRPLTDVSTIIITELDFNAANSECVYITPNTKKEDECIFPLQEGEMTLETREVKITLSGNLNSDASTKITLEQDVRVRNDVVRTKF